MGGSDPALCVAAEIVLAPCACEPVEYAELMNTQYQPMNAAAIDRHQLIDRARRAQSALGTRNSLRFEEFARSRGGALYELSSACDIERALAQFEWAKLDQLYGAIFRHAIRRDAIEEPTVGALCKEARSIVRAKLQRLARRPAGRIVRALGRASFVAFLAVLFMTVSSIAGEACLHFAPYLSDAGGIR